MTLRLTALLAVLILTGCAYALETQQQEVTFNTIGAKNARCDVWVRGLNYKVYPPQTITINRSQEDLIVDCKAPGRREKKLIVPSTLNDNTMMNVATAGVGFAYDYLSQSMFTYPSRIEIDFTDQTARMQDLPKHNDPDLIPPEDYIREEYGPSTPALNSDRDRPVYTIEKRVSASGDQYEAPVSYSDKGDLMPVGASDPAPSGGVAPAAVNNDFAPVVPNAMVNPGAAPQTVPSYPGE